MGKYLAQRLLLAIPTMVLVSIGIFLFVRMLPGDAVDAILVQQSSSANKLQRDQLEKQLGLDKPAVEQYFDWMGGVFHWDFGQSLSTHRPVTQPLSARLPVTLVLALMALIIGLLIAIPIGVCAAYFQDSFIDYVLRSGAVLGLAIPSFWLSIMVVIYSSKWFGWNPAGQYVPLSSDPIQSIKSLLIPAAVLGLGVGATTMRYVRTQMLEVMKQDYIRTARAKGISERTVLIRHTLRNSLIPIVTVVGLQVPVLIGGTVIIENIFGVPGMGQMTLDAIGKRDYPTIQMINLIFAAFVIGINLLVDLTYPVLDPRIRSV
jgi:peptide/nickel transport system permease protein